MTSSTLAFLTAAMVVTVLLNLLILHKVVRVHLLQYRLLAGVDSTELEARTLYRQIESFQHLMSLLKLEKPLPPLRGWAASPDFLLLVAQHMLSGKPYRAIECSSGASTLVLARCMQIIGHGHVYSLEHEAHYAEQTRAQLRDQGLEEWATVCDAPLESVQEGHVSPWYSLKNLPDDARECRLLVVDGPPKDTGPLARLPALPRLANRLHPECVVLLDDADRPDEKVIVQKWLESDPTLEKRDLPCEKGCAALLRKRSESATSRVTL